METSLPTPLERMDGKIGWGSKIPPSIRENHIVDHLRNPNIRAPDDPNT